MLSPSIVYKSSNQRKYYSSPPNTDDESNKNSLSPSIHSSEAAQRSLDHKLVSKESEGFIYDPNSRALSPIRAEYDISLNELDSNFNKEKDDQNLHKLIDGETRTDDKENIDDAIKERRSATRDSGISSAYQSDSRKHRLSFEEKLSNFLDDEDENALNHSFNATNTNKEVMQNLL